MPAAEMPMPCWPAAHAQPVELRAVEQLAEDRRDLLLDDARAVVADRDAEPRLLAGRGGRPCSHDLDVTDVGQDAGLLAGVERVVHRLLDGR